MRAALLVLASVGVLATGFAYAESGADVVKAKGCLGCHDVEAKKVGPSFKDIAAKYKSDKAASGKLVEKLKEGKGHMKVAAPDADLKAAVGYVLSTK